jgi:hypothetical protein
MYKYSIFFQNINDLSSFKEFLSDEVLPQFAHASDLLQVQMTSIGPSVDPTPENLLPVQLIFEIYTETSEELDRFLESADGSELIHLLMNNPYGEAGAFFGEEKFLIPEQVHSQHKVAGELTDFSF